MDWAFQRSMSLNWLEPENGHMILLSPMKMQGPYIQYLGFNTVDQSYSIFFICKKAKLG